MGKRILQHREERMAADRIVKKNEKEVMLVLGVR